MSPSFRNASSTESAEPRSTAARSAAAKFSSFMRTRPRLRRPIASRRASPTGRRAARSAPGISRWSLCCPESAWPACPVHAVSTRAGVARSSTADRRADRLPSRNPLQPLVLRAVVPAFKLVRPLMQLVTEILQQLGDPSVAGLFGQAIAFFRLGANVVGKVSHCPVTLPQGAGLGLPAQSFAGAILRAAQSPRASLKIEQSSVPDKYAGRRVPGESDRRFKPLRPDPTLAHPLPSSSERAPPRSVVRARDASKRGISFMLNRIQAVAQRPIARRWLAATAGLAMALAALPAKAQDTIKVGILHSLSGTMAISETTLKDVMLMLIDEQNKKGGLLGKKLEAVVVDPASNWPLFAEKARELITKDKVAAVFGCWTSVSRKSVLPVFKELNGLLFYPVQYEGEESERNVFYTGAAPNQQAIPAVDYLAKEEKVQRWVLAGTDYVYPRTTNKILEAYLKSKGVKSEDIMINYTPFGHADFQTIVADIKKFGTAGKKTAVVSTINGDANVPFYKELGNQGIKATDIPSVAFSVGEEELAGIDTKPLLGHLAAWNYFESIKTPGNAEFIKKWKAFTKNPKRVSNDPMEAHVIGFAMWVEAVKKAGSTDPDKVIDAVVGVKVPNLTGGTSKMLPNHHITKPVFIGEVRGDGQFD